MAAGTRDEWTDGRLDDLNRRVDRGFEQVDKRFEQVDKRFERLEGSIEGIHRTLTHAVIGITGTMVAGFGSVLALVVALS